MLVGDQQRFAVEFELDAGKLSDPVLKEWLFGRVCFWCGGERVGQYEQETTIRDVASEAARFLDHEGTRNDAALLAAPLETVINVVVNALYVDRGQPDAQVRADSNRYGRFVVSPEVDVFDPWRILLVEGESKARLIWWKEHVSGARECELRPGEFDSVLKEFLGALRTM